MDSPKPSSAETLEHMFTGAAAPSSGAKDRMNKPVEMIETPMFLVGAERSGTTLLRLMLDHHPEIACWAEFEFAVDRISDGGDWPDLDEYVQWLELDRVLEEGRFAVRRTDNYRQMVNDFLLQKRERDGKTVVGATLHRHFNRALRIWPDARFIHLVRDPRDVARSSIQMGWAGNTAAAMDRWLTAEFLWDRLRAELPADRWVELRFEELIRQPEATLDRVCRLLGLRFDNAMFDYVQTTSYGLPDPKLTEQWRRKLSQFEIRLCESRLGSRLQRAGYEASGLPPLRVGGALRLWLRVQNQWSKRRFRVRRFGWRLVIADWLCRRLPAPARWRAHVRSRMYEISKSYWR